MSHIPVYFRTFGYGYMSESQGEVEVVTEWSGVQRASKQVRKITAKVKKCYFG